jgi:hypothetical protein
MKADYRLKKQKCLGRLKYIVFPYSLEIQLSASLDYCGHICALCSQSVSFWKDLEIFLKCPRKKQFYRNWAHKECCYNYIQSLINRLEHNDTRSYALLVRRAAQILLLLVELGLPSDLAWPVAGAACWLL